MIVREDLEGGLRFLIPKTERMLTDIEKLEGNTWFGRNMLIVLSSKSWQDIRNVRLIEER